MEKIYFDCKIFVMGKGMKNFYYEWMCGIIRTQPPLFLNIGR